MSLKSNESNVEGKEYATIAQDTLNVESSASYHS